MFSESIDKLEDDRENEAVINSGKPPYCEEIPFSTRRKKYKNQIIISCKNKPIF